MKEIINIYKSHKIEVEYYIHSIIANMSSDYIESANKILKKHKFIQLMYEVDKNYKQTSSKICREKSFEKDIGNDKSHYFVRLKLDDKGVYISNPYVHYKTGRVSVSVVVANDEKYEVMDIDLILLLQHLKLIEYNHLYERYKKIVYSVGSVFLSIVSILLIIYGGYSLIEILFDFNNIDFLQAIFKSIISITLGLAMFDFAKQIFEHEVLFQSFEDSEYKQYRVLGKFLISIIIALSIETLMVVFKIALSDYTQMLSAFYLILGTTIMFVGLAYFYKIFSDKDKEEL